MELLWKGIGASLLACILVLVIGKQEKDLSVLLIIGGCTAVLVIVVSYLKPVFSFIRELEEIGTLNGDHLTVLLKAVGVGIITEIAALICADSGSAGLGKTLQILGSAVILWLSIPVFQALLDLIRSILGDI